MHEKKYGPLYQCKIVFPRFEKKEKRTANNKKCEGLMDSYFYCKETKKNNDPTGGNILTISSG